MGENEDDLMGYVERVAVVSEVVHWVCGFILLSVIIGFVPLWGLTPPPNPS